MTRFRKPLLVLLSALLIFLASWSGYNFAYAADLMDWDCGGASCATNDSRAMLNLVAIFGAIAATVVSGSAVGLIGPAITIGSVTFWFRRGFEDAIVAGHTPEASVGGVMTFTVVMFIIAALFFVGWVWMCISRARWRRKRDRRLAQSNA